MTVQIDQIFTATAENIWTFLSTAGQGCYIPAYQRPYAWDSRNVDRLFEDAISGINHVVSRPAAISFLGTLIAIHDVTHATVQPIFKPEVAPRVMTIIDGQQRITTSVMINIALHSHLSSALAKLGKVTGDEFEWLREQSELALAELWTTFAMDRTTGTPQLYRWYPRVIRAIDDVWSKKKVQAKYESPIAALIWSYISYLQDPALNKSKDFVYKATRDGQPDPRHTAISEVFGHIVWQIERFTGRYAERYDFPDLQQVVGSSAFMGALWSYPAPEHVIRFVSEGSNSKLYTYYTTVLRTLIFYKYFCTRMALTIVTTRTEDDAFDMFEALNTTGEPLTAFETFRPKVIENEGLGNWEGSPSQRSMERVAGYLDAFKKADERQRATAELLIPFALAETGSKLSKSLSDQRRYLRDTYQELSDIEEKRSLVASMASLAAFMETGWQANINKTPHIEGVAEFDEVTGFCFQALRNLKHNVAIASLSRFYDELRRAGDDERGARAGDFVAAIRATTAFSMLWRGAKGGTENIDQKYRSFMRDGSIDLKIPPLAKRSNAKRGLTSLSNYQRLLRLEFSTSYPDRDTWVAEASRTPIYDSSATVAKFLLICASNDTVSDGTEGLIKKGRAGVSPTIRSDIWRSDATFSVEHVAPQTRPSSGWDDSIYEPGTKHVARLGNLTLLPTAANGYVGNKSWKQKRLLYRFFSSETQEAADLVASEFASAGLSVSEHGQMLLETSAYMPMLKAVGQYTSDWNAGIIEQRSVRLAQLAYDSIINWLGSDSALSDE